VRASRHRRHNISTTIHAHAQAAHSTATFRREKKRRASVRPPSDQYEQEASRPTTARSPQPKRAADAGRCHLTAVSRRFTEPGVWRPGPWAAGFRLALARAARRSARHSHPPGAATGQRRCACAWRCRRRFGRGGQCDSCTQALRCAAAPTATACCTLGKRKPYCGTSTLCGGQPRRGTHRIHAPRGGCHRAISNHGTRGPHDPHRAATSRTT
jgi:hypothetical protein